MFIVVVYSDGLKYSETFLKRGTRPRGPRRPPGCLRSGREDRWVSTSSAVKIYSRKLNPLPARWLKVAPLLSGGLKPPGRATEWQSGSEYKKLFIRWSLDGKRRLLWRFLFLRRFGSIDTKKALKLKNFYFINDAVKNLLELKSILLLNHENLRSTKTQNSAVIRYFIKAWIIYYKYIWFY